MYFKKSPCIGVCEIDTRSPFCHGCMRDLDELSVWKSLSDEQKKPRWMQLGQRRSQFPGPSIIRDQLRRLVTIPTPVERIVSLVPSLTQTLYDLDLASKVVGTTVFCPPPPASAHGVSPQPIGGTKKLNLERIRQLRPDLIIANKEENIQADVEALATEFPVWVSDVVTCEQSMQLIWLLGEYLNRQDRALELVDRIRASLPQPLPTEISASFVYFIWRRPWMVAAADTYIDNLLRQFGLHNCCADLQRYPEVTLAQVQALSPQLVFLPDEPYRFSERERHELQALFPSSTILPVSGKLCSWFGSVMAESIPYLQQMRSW